MKKIGYSFFLSLRKLLQNEMLNKESELKRITKRGQKHANNFATNLIDYQCFVFLELPTK